MKRSYSVITKTGILSQTSSEERIFKAMLRLLPYQILGSMSTIILLLVDGLVVGNYLGSDALSSVNLISPLATFIGAFCAVVGSGISIALSKAMVSSDRDDVKRVYKSAFYLSIFTILLITVVEIPATHLIIGSYHLSGERLSLVWSYSYGVLFALVISSLSTIGTYILASIGEAKKLATLTIIETCVNVFFDIFLVIFCHMGVAGAGYGTAIACSVRAILTIILILKTVKIFPLIKGPCLSDMVNITITGSYQFYSNAMLFLKNYFVALLIMRSVGSEGFAAYSVFCFAITIVNSFSSAITQSVGPFNGMLTGIGEWEGGSLLLKKTLALSFIVTTLLSGIIFFAPKALFLIYSIQDVSSLQITIVKIMAFMLPFLSLNKILQNYMTYCRMKRYASIASALQFVVILLPLSLLLCRLSNMGVFISFVISNALVFVLTVVLYESKIRKIKIYEKCIDSLNLTIKKEQASVFSQEINDFFIKIYKDEALANKLSVCAEEASAYVSSIDIIFRAFEDHVTLFVINSDRDESFIDALIDDENVPILNNYFIMRKLSDKYSYHNICGLNSYTLVFNVPDCQFS